MKATVLAICLTILPTAVLARDVTCQSTTYCDGGNCEPWTSTLAVTAEADGTATYRWDDAPMNDATVLQDNATLIIADATDEGSGSMLIIGESGQATFTTATDFGDYLISGFYLLTCEVTS